LNEAVRTSLWAEGPQIELLDDLQIPVMVSSAQRGQVQRIVQEALSNAVRHSGATQIQVYLGREGSDLCVSVEDNGRGFNYNPSTEDMGEHFGLRIIQARAARIGGRVRLDTAPGHGTRVILIWPAGLSG
jgi:signal transduction histidine kinase